MYNAKLVSATDTAINFLHWLLSCSRLRNDLLCNEWDVKLYSLAHLISCQSLSGTCRLSVQLLCRTLCRFSLAQSMLHFLCLRDLWLLGVPIEYLLSNSVIRQRQNVFSQFQTHFSNSVTELLSSLFFLISWSYLYNLLVAEVPCVAMVHWK